MTAQLRPCPVCHADSTHARLFLESTIDEAKLSGSSFSSRKEPEYMSHRLMQCQACDLVYVDAPPAAGELAQAYHEADYDSSEEADDAAAAYIGAAQSALSALRQRKSALEIGTGTAVFLERLKAEGFETLIGIEPSTEAIRAAPAHRRAWIREGIFEERDYEPESFDLICCFMTLEHVPDPRVVATAALRLLRPGGAFIAVTHDYRSFVNRVLGKRSPIIDVEHMQLFSQKSVRRLFDEAGFENVAVKAFVNRYRVRYWMRLVPIPRGLKSASARVLGATGIDRIRLGANVGNLFTAGFKRG